MKPNNFCETEKEICEYLYHKTFCKIRTCGENVTGWTACAHPDYRNMIQKEPNRNIETKTELFNKGIRVIPL